MATAAMIAKGSSWRNCSFFDFAMDNGGDEMDWRSDSSDCSSSSSSFFGWLSFFETTTRLFGFAISRTSLSFSGETLGGWVSFVGVLLVRNESSWSGAWLWQLLQRQ